MVSMVARRPVDAHILTAARGAMQGRSRPPLSRLSRRTHDRRAGFEPRAPAVLGLLLHFQRVFDGVEGRELDIVKLALHLLDLADVDVLDDVARLRIDRDRSARAFPFHALHRVDQGVAAGLALGLLERLVHQMHAVVAAERDEVRRKPFAFLKAATYSLLVGELW